MALTQAEMNEKINTFIKERELLEIPRERVVDQARWWERKGNLVRYTPYVTLVSEFNPVAGTVPTQYESSRKMVSHKDLVDFIDEIPVDNADAVYTVPAGEQKSIQQMYADLVTVAGGGNKDFTMTIVKDIAGAGVLAAMVTGAIAVVPGNNASIGMFRGGPTWLNNNAVIANEDTNVAGIVLQAGDTITVTWTNKVADDRARLSVGEIDLPVI